MGAGGRDFHNFIMPDLGISRGYLKKPVISPTNKKDPYHDRDTYARLSGISTEAFLIVAQQEHE
jgi:hypothetical protein